MSSLGNQFVLVDGLTQTPPQVRSIAQQQKAEFDQLLLVEQSKVADVRMRVFNRDGQEVEQCGNGLRCVAYYVKEQGFLGNDSVRIETQGRIAEATVLENNQVRAVMGAAVFTPPQIPLLVDTQQQRYSIKGIDLHALKESMPRQLGVIADILGSVGAVSMGNPHAVLDVSALEDITDELVTNLGLQFQHLYVFPQQVNVGFMRITDRNHIDLRVYERGVGETRACGSGACAAVAVGRLWGVLDDAVQVHLPGGVLDIRDDARQGLIVTGSVVLH